MSNVQADLQEWLIALRNQVVGERDKQLGKGNKGFADLLHGLVLHMNEPIADLDYLGSSLKVEGRSERWGQ